MTAQISELRDKIDNPEKPKENNFKYSHCSFTASTSAVLKRHITMNNKSPNFSCKDCNLKFTSNTNLQEHRDIKHKPKSPEKEIERYDPLNDSLVLSQDVEERSEDHSSSFSSHIDTPSPTNDPLPSSPTETLFEKGAFICCSNQATQFFSFTKIDNTKYNDLLICNPCTRFIPLKELRGNPPALFP